MLRLRLVVFQLAGWLRSQITRIEQQLAKSTGLLLEERDEFSKLAET
jgi:hypothetical protein